VKVLFVIDGLGTGGAERSLSEMLPGVVAGGLTPIVACLHHRKEGVEQAVANKFDVRFISSSVLPAQVRLLRRIIASERPDLVHTVLFASHVAGRIAAIGGPPVLSSLVNTQYAKDRLDDPSVHKWALNLVRIIDGWTARHLTTHFHALTGAVKAHAVDVLGVPADRVTVIPRGRDPARLGHPGHDRRSKVRHALGLNGDDEVLLNVGRQEHQKGQSYLLTAFAQIVPRRPRAVLLIAGREGSASAGLVRRLDDLGLRGRVKFLGYRDDLPDVLAAADLFLFPSLFEGLGGALIEAMAMGLPVVGSDLAAIREVVEVGRSALLVPPRDPGAMADAIDHLLSHPKLLAEFGARGMSIFQERFTLASSTALMLELYRDLVPPAESTQGDGGDSKERALSVLRGGPLGTLGSIALIKSSHEPGASNAVKRTLTKPRVLQVITDTDRRGAEVFAVDLATELVARGRTVETVALVAGSSNAPLPVHVLGTKRLGVATILALRRAARTAQVVVAHGSASLPACAIALLGSRIPFIYRNIGDPLYWATSMLRRLLQRVLLTRARVIVAVWPGAAEALKSGFGVPSGKLRTIPKACPGKRFSPIAQWERESARRRIGLADGVPTVVYLGALSPEKNVEAAIRAIGELPPAVLLLAGDGPDRLRLQAIARTVAPDRVLFLGATDRPEDILAAGDLLVLPSKTEGVPGALIEAGLRGLPVVATGVGGVPFMVAGSSMSVLIEPGDQDALTQAVRVSLSQPSPDNRVRADWSERFEIAAAADAWDQLLGECGAWSREQSDG
jgi:glycosyltransferase involved in cell wall biosynthesis